jgi:hypothetical protein
MNLEPTGTVPPDFRVIAVEETRNWNPKVIEQTGRMAGIYLVNFAEIVHICDFTGSYYAKFICNISENYVREPDGYMSGNAIWDKEWEREADPIEVSRSKALFALKADNFKYENGGEDGHYISEHGFNREQGEKIENPDPEEPLTEDAAMEAVQALMANGEEWEDLAPWKKEAVTA